MEQDWTKITRGVGDVGNTGGTYCAHHKSDWAILFQSYLEDAQALLGLVAFSSDFEKLTEVSPGQLEEIFRKIMGVVSGYKQLDKYRDKFGDEVFVNDSDIELLEKGILKVGTFLNDVHVKMGWVNYTQLSGKALIIGRLTTAVRKAEAVFFRFLKHEAIKFVPSGVLDKEIIFLNRLSKLTYVAMVMQNVLDQ